LIDPVKVAVEMSARSCIKFNMMGKRFTIKFETAVLYHTTINGNVVVQDAAEDIVVPLAAVVEPPVQLSRETQVLISALIKEFDAQFGELASAANVRPEVIKPCIVTDPNASIPNRPLRRYNLAERDEIKAEVDILLQQNIISPSMSPYGLPILMI
jgi:hypothetical protein